MSIGKKLEIFACLHPIRPGGRLNGFYRNFASGGINESVNLVMWIVVWLQFLLGAIAYVYS